MENFFQVASCRLPHINHNSKFLNSAYYVPDVLTHLVQQEPCKIQCAVIVNILQVTKLRHREVKLPAQHHTAGRL